MAPDDKSNDPATTIAETFIRHSSKVMELVG